MKKVDLDVSWDQPEFVKESDEIVVFRKRLEPFKDLTTTMDEVAEEGDLVYRTVDLSLEKYSFIDYQLERGHWHYAVFAKNKAGLSPGQIEDYLLADVNLTILNFDFKTFSPGILSFDISISGSDASSWRWKINEGEWEDKSLNDVNIIKQVDLGRGTEHILTVQSLNVDGYVSATRTVRFNVYLLTVKFITHPNLNRADILSEGIQNTLVPLNALDVRGHYFDG